MSDIRYVEHKDFRANIQKMVKAGGSSQKAAVLVQAMFGRISFGQDPFEGLQVTNNGETRIDKCVKYDLAGRARLITVQDEKVVFFLFLGNHEDTDKWLDRHKDIKFSVNKQLIVNFVPASVSTDERISAGDNLSYHSEQLFKLFEPQELFDRVLEGISRATCRDIENLTGAHSEEEIFKVVSSIDIEEHAKALYDALVLIRSDNFSAANDRLKLFLGDSREIDELPPEEIVKIKFGDAFIEFRPDDKEFLARADQVMMGGDYKSWMLFMHPEQEKIATANLTGPAKLIGVSGSGKTCVVVRRAIWLATEYPDEKILVITLNKPLAHLIESLVKAAAPTELAERIDVLPFFKLCQKLLASYEPHNQKIYDDKTWKSEEHIDEVWTEFYRCELNNEDAKVLLPIHKTLIQRGINSEHYIREEFDWIRSAFPKKRRNEYLKTEREGRVIPFDADARTLILKGLELWEKKMRDIGICDYLGLATELYQYKDLFKTSYRSIIIDECQDFGTIELEVIRSLTPPSKNDIFLCGDAAQKVQTKRQSMRLAGIECSNRSLALKKNYRNTKDVLRAAHHILKHHYNAEHQPLEDYELLDPELADRSGTTPLILEANSLGSEFSYALNYLQDEILKHPGRKACIAYCGFTSYEVKNLSERVGIPLLDGAIDIDISDIFLSDLEQTKGFEFDYVVILNCSEEFLPDQAAPKEEQFRDISKFYVAMTRTKHQLILSYCNELSKLMSDSEDYFIKDTWDSWLDGVSPNKNVYEPIRIEINRGEGSDNSLSLSGIKFIYHSDAIGLNTRSIEVILNLVDGKGLRDKRGAKKWKSIGQLLSDMAADTRVKNILGSIAFEDIKKSKFARRSEALTRTVELSKLSRKKENHNI
ncbi:UvrD-helicase domain-containing protein [Pseudomonas syringae group sp. 243L2]|uniref:UvrD-helicase domain-containing protein n=1 Tax=Pseudomonas syringae group sp. 243L2 TaxID=3079593 RepID=UPI002907A7F3|nr:UvrD-helicase domain-containing protein [Pseudomonas syringae group sp. 243L2]MDU8631353.1 3'-5' exonuclease [Pseudomonas syringae group sp. 243L2]